MQRIRRPVKDALSPPLPGKSRLQLPSLHVEHPVLPVEVNLVRHFLDEGTDLVNKGFVASGDNEGALVVK